MKVRGLILLMIFITGCKTAEEESIALTNKANKIFLDFSLNDSIRVDSALVLIDKAIALDEDNVSAYTIKATLLAEKRDVKEALANNQKIIELKPLQPYWKIQRGIYLELAGKPDEADSIYSIGVKQYEELFKNDSVLRNDFNFRLEYITALEAKGDTLKYKRELDIVKSRFPDNEIVKMYDSVFPTREKAIKMWRKDSFD